MPKIRVLSDHVANQIAAGEVVERPASVAKELIENSIDAGARRIEVETEAGGRRLLRVGDDGGGMTRDDAVLAFERHATSKISRAEDLNSIATLGFRGEALASIASVARVELITHEGGDEAEGARVVIEGGRMRDVLPAGRARGTTVTMRDLFFNVPARRKFLRSEATENYHLTNLVTHYALAHPEIEFVLSSNGREVVRAAPARDLRERAYQIFGAEFVENLLEVNGGHKEVARARGFVSAPRERRTSRDAQYMFVNGRFVRDKLVSRALSEAYRSVLPHGVYPAALLFLDVPLEEVDVNVHPAKTEVRFRRAAAVADAVRESVRRALASGDFLRAEENSDEAETNLRYASNAESFTDGERNILSFDSLAVNSAANAATFNISDSEVYNERPGVFAEPKVDAVPQQEKIEFHFTSAPEDNQPLRGEAMLSTNPSSAINALTRNERRVSIDEEAYAVDEVNRVSFPSQSVASQNQTQKPAAHQFNEGVERKLPQFVSAIGLVQEAKTETLSPNIRPLGQLEESFIIATDADGLLLIDQHVAHERILFDKYNRLEAARESESQNLLLPETFDLTPAQAAAFDTVVAQLETYGFDLMRLSGRTVAIKAVPADLPPAEAKNLLTEVLETVDAEKRGAARVNLRERIAASLACRAAIKINMPLTMEKMLWLIDRLLTTSSPTTCPHGRPVVLRLATRDIEKGFHRT
ncbi:MAG: DNA mismatch repair endonuclease MutL [Pyrinomonadaceae bacterium]|nr:DNA mismatch repair endonuclease MutL [Pyrinomonadaceae bacterium]